jgi:hypothetical protein
LWRDPNRGVRRLADTNDKNSFWRTVDGTRSRSRHCVFKEASAMSKEKPNDDPRRQTDWKSTKQTDQPWKGQVEKEQKPHGTAKPDLERWHDSDTH